MVAPSGGDRCREWLTRWSVLLACLATAVVHLLYLTRQLGVDEGGFAMVARFWRSGGHFLYGPSWVDRPPGLIAVFAAAERLGPYGVRLAAAGLAVVLVAAVASAADAIGGRPAARWAAWTGFALVSSMLFQAERLNGELVAATFVAVSMAAVIRAVRVSRGGVHAALLGLLAGAAAGAAVLAKQNFVDGFAFAVVLLVVGSLTRVNRRVFRPVLVVTTAAAFLAGALLPAAGALLWARSHGGAGAMAYAMYGFRSDAAAVIANWSWHAPLHRLGVLSGHGRAVGAAAPAREPGLAARAPAPSSRPAAMGTHRRRRGGARGRGRRGELLAALPDRTDPDGRAGHRVGRAPADAGPDLDPPAGAGRGPLDRGGVAARRGPRGAGVRAGPGRSAAGWPPRRPRATRWSSRTRTRT